MPGSVNVAENKELMRLTSEPACPESEPWAMGADQGAQALDPAKIPAGLGDQSATQLSVEAYVRGGNKYEEQAEALLNSED